MGVIASPDDVLGESQGVVELLEAFEPHRPSSRVGHAHDVAEGSTHIRGHDLYGRNSDATRCLVTTRAR